MRIDETAFVVFDTETTGSGREDRLIEIGAVKLKGGQIVDRYSQLVNPERAIPGPITRLTGITTAMVYDQPTVDQVLPSFFEFCGDAVLVAHNLAFDWRVLGQECVRVGLELPEFPLLCTLRLSRRLLPTLPSKGLKALSVHFKVTLESHHRALADATATAEVLIHLLRLFQMTVQSDQTEALLQYQHRTYRKASGESRRISSLRKVASTLPLKPGVYFFKDGRGHVLYVGKARRLRHRVGSYFSAVPAQEVRLQRLVRAVRRIEWQETRSELEALLLESRLIKTLKPRFNRAQRRYRNYPFIRLDTTHPFPTVSVAAVIFNDGAEYFGPLSNRKQAEQVVELIHRLFQLRRCTPQEFAQGRGCLYYEMNQCLAPCLRSRAERYEEEVDAVRAFLTGQDAYVLNRVAQAMQEASREQAYEEARFFRDQLRGLERLFAQQKYLAHAVKQYHGVIIHRESSEEWVLIAVRYSRAVGFLRVLSCQVDEKGVVEWLREHFCASFDLPEWYTPEMVDEVRVLAHWLYGVREEVYQVYWNPTEDFNSFKEQVIRTLYCRMCAIQK